eukprot:EG_transcript_35224
MSVFPIDQCVEAPVLPLPCDRCGGVRWPFNCPPPTTDGVLACVVDVVSQSALPLGVRAVRPLDALPDAAFNVSFWDSNEWKLLGSTHISQAPSPVLFASPVPLLSNGTLRLRLMVDQPGALLASPTDEVHAGMFAQAAAKLVAVASWPNASTQHASPRLCHVSVEICKQCSDAPAPGGD